MTVVPTDSNHYSIKELAISEEQFSYKIQFGISHAQIIYRTSADISRRNLCFNLSTYCNNNFYLELDF